MFAFLRGYKKLSDEDLMRKISEEDNDAFEVLYDRYSAALMTYFHRMLWKDRQKAEDFLQDLFTKVWKNAKDFDYERSCKTWLYSIAFNMCKNEYKKQERQNTKTEEILPDIQLNNERTEHGMDLKKFSLALDSELDKLNEEHRSVFIMRYKDELSIKEIAEILNLPEGTVKSRLFYSIKKLSVSLKTYEKELLK